MPGEPRFEQDDAEALERDGWMNATAPAIASCFSCSDTKPRSMHVRLRARAAPSMRPAAGEHELHVPAGALAERRM